MAYKIGIDEEKGLFIVDFYDESGLDEIKKAYEEILEHPQFVKGINGLWDLSKSKNRVPGIGEIRRFQLWNESVLKKRGTGFKTAVIFRKNIEYGMARIFQAYTEKLPYELKVFYDRQKAMDWITS